MFRSPKSHVVIEGIDCQNLLGFYYQGQIKIKNKKVSLDNLLSSY